MCKHEYSEHYSSHHRIKYCRNATFDQYTQKMLTCTEAKSYSAPKSREYEYRRESYSEYRKRYCRIEDPDVEEIDRERCTRCKHRHCSCVEVYELYRRRPSRKRVYEIYF